MAPVVSRTTPAIAPLSCATAGRGSETRESTPITDAMTDARCARMRSTLLQTHRFQAAAWPTGRNITSADLLSQLKIGRPGWPPELRRDPPDRRRRLQPAHRQEVEPAKAGSHD